MTISVDSFISLFFSPTSTPNLKNGVGVGIYSPGTSYFIYFGSYENNVRSGFGIWIGVDIGSYIDYVFEGLWQNDKPNGEGKETWYGEFYDGGNGVYTTVDTIIQTTYKDGLHNGQVREEWFIATGTHNIWNYNSIDGLAINISTDSYSYIAAYCENSGGTLVGSDNRRGVEGVGRGNY